MYTTYTTLNGETDTTLRDGREGGWMGGISSHFLGTWEVLSHSLSLSPAAMTASKEGKTNPTIPVVCWLLKTKMRRGSSATPSTLCVNLLFFCRGTWMKIGERDTHKWPSRRSWPSSVKPLKNVVCSLTSG